MPVGQFPKCCHDVVFFLLGRARGEGVGSKKVGSKRVGSKRVGSQRAGSEWIGSKGAGSKWIGSKGVVGKGAGINKARGKKVWLWRRRASWRRGGGRKNSGRR